MASHETYSYFAYVFCILGKAVGLQRQEVCDSLLLPIGLHFCLPNRLDAEA